MRRHLITTIIAAMLSCHLLTGQYAGIKDYFSDIELNIDTNTFFLSEDTVHYKKKKRVFFYFDHNAEVCEVIMTPHDTINIDSIKLLPSGDYDIIDSILFVNDEHYRFKVRFNDLLETDFLKFPFLLRTSDDSIPRLRNLPLFPYTKTSVQFRPITRELFIGEEKVFEFLTENPEIIQLQPQWTEGEAIDYRISFKFDQLRVHLLPNILGKHDVEIQLKTKRPFLNEDNTLTNELPPITASFEVKRSRLRYLNMDKNEITLDEEAQTKGIEIQIDDNRLLKKQKTYRIEAQEKPGGNLIAEIYTRSELSNNKVLCLLRPYNYHKKSQGYLYIKDGDTPMFITNLNITPKTTIEKISLMPEGKEWTNNLVVHPGETVEMRIEGKGLHKSRFHFEDLQNVSEDTMLRTETVLMYKFRVPMDIAKSKINLYNHGEKTGHTIQLKEYNVPREFDFINLAYGTRRRKLSHINKPILYEGTIRDITFSFLNNDIDSRGQIHGKQYIDINIRITDKNNKLIEMRSIEDIVVCPGEKSPRFEFYNKNDCRYNDINLNEEINRKIYELEEWSKIELVISHKKDKYGGNGYTKKVDIILKKSYNFDIDVSFPAGLLIKKAGESGYGNFGGISMAMIAQFSFYHPDKIAKYRPYKIGAGFLALNAFNFNEDNQGRDLGAVILGSIYPTSKDTKLSFPLYLGGGFLLDQSKWFLLIGPGIRVKL